MEIRTTESFPQWAKERRRITRKSLKALDAEQKQPMVRQYLKEILDRGDSVVVLVHAVMVCDPDDLTDEADSEVEGVYPVSVPPEVPADSVANAALDAFHESVAVDTLDDFSFHVTLQDRDQTEVYENPDVESYKFRDVAALL